MFVYVTSSSGIAVFSLDAAGGLSEVQEPAGLERPFFLAMHPTLAVLYAAEREPGAGPPRLGRITTLALTATGQVSQLARRETGAAAHLMVHPNGRVLFAAMSWTAKATAFRLEADGRVGPETAAMSHLDLGPVSPRRPAVFPHSVWLDHAQTQLFVPDLGLDRILIYDLDGEQLRAAAWPFAQVSSGAGPRHLTVHPGDRIVYSLNQIDSTITVFARDDKGRLGVLQTASTLPAGWQGANDAGHVAVDSAGRFLYASNRGHDSIAVLAIIAEDGRLGSAIHYPCGGERPINFGLDPSGSFLVVANHGSNLLTSFRVAEGTLELVSQVDVPTPTCVAFRALPV